MKQTFTDSFVLSLCLILVLLSVLSNCHNPIELIVTTCACGAVYQVVPVYQCTSVPGTHRTFPRFARAAIDSHVQHDSLTRTKIFSPKSAAVIFRQEARGWGGFNPLGWAIPIIFCLAAFWGKLGCRGKLELGGRLRLWKKQLRFNFCHLPFPSNTREKPSLRRSIRCQSSHNWTPPQPLLLRVSCGEKQASRWILENKLLFLSRCQFHAYTQQREGDVPHISHCG